MKYLITMLLLCSTATAQTFRAATTTSTAAPTAYTKAGVDTLIARLERRIAALESRVISLSAGAADTLRNINTHLTAMRNRTEAVNTNWWRADQTITARIDSGVVAQRIVNTATTAQLNGLQGQVKQVADTQAAQQAALNKVEAWIRNY